MIVANRNFVVHLGLAFLGFSFAETDNASATSIVVPVDQTMCTSLVSNIPNNKLFKFSDVEVTYSAGNGAGKENIDSEVGCVSVTGSRPGRRKLRIRGQLSQHNEKGTYQHCKEGPIKWTNPFLTELNVSVRPAKFVDDGFTKLKLTFDHDFNYPIKAGGIGRNSRYQNLVIRDSAVDIHPTTSESEPLLVGGHDEDSAFYYWIKGGRIFFKLGHIAPRTTVIARVWLTGDIYQQSGDTKCGCSEYKLMEFKRSFDVEMVGRNR